MLVSDDPRRADVRAIFEVAESYRLLIRVWIEYLSRAQTILADEYDEAELRALEGTLLASANLRQRILGSMTELDVLSLAARDNGRRAIMADVVHRLDLVPLREVAERRLAAVTDYNGMLANVIDRLYQEAGRRQGLKLQALFAGALAAGIVALVPALAAIASGETRDALIPIVVLSVILIWLCVVLLLARMGVTIRFGPRRKRK